MSTGGHRDSPRQELSRLVSLLIEHGVRVFRAEEPVTAGYTTYPQGTYVIPAAQPYRAFLLTMLRPQRYPEVTAYRGGPVLPPYDATTWSLPTAGRGRRSARPSTSAASLSPVNTENSPLGRPASSARAASARVDPTRGASRGHPPSRKPAAALSAPYAPSVHATVPTRSAKAPADAPDNSRMPTTRRKIRNWAMTASTAAASPASP